MLSWTLKLYGGPLDGGEMKMKDEAEVCRKMDELLELSFDKNRPEAIVYGFPLVYGAQNNRVAWYKITVTSVGLKTAKADFMKTSTIGSQL